jgi:anthranilate phosphoribosyltransferase
MRAILDRLFTHAVLSRQEAYRLLINIASAPLSQVAALMTVYRMRPVSADELMGFRDAMIELCLVIDLSEFVPIDLCGTGGDGKETFNISTLASFVVAGAGIKVAKHGNYGVSSLCGSSNVLEYLGVRFTGDRDRLRRMMDRAGICYLHAPLFHPAMKTVAPVRRELGIKTFFNILGPLVNPASPAAQAIGVYNLELARLYGYVHQQSDRPFVILHSLDGYDEVSLTGPFKAITRSGENVIQPDELALPMVAPSDLSAGKDVPETAEIFMRILSRRGTPAQNAVVIANAAMAISVARPTMPMADCVAGARDSLLSGRALNAFTVFRELGG